MLVLAAAPGFARCEEPLFLVGPSQGTTYHIRLGQRLTEGSAAELHSEIDALLAEIDRHMSTYHEDSDLARFNRSSSVEWIAVSPDLVTVVRAALAIYRQSAGTFDVTVAPLVNLWGFGPGGHPGRLPADDEIARARRAVGSDLVEVRADPPALRKRQPDVRLDLNGIAPGYAVDCIGRLLEQHHVTNYLVELGGEIRTRGHTMDGRLWRVGIERPSALPSGVQLAIELGDGAVSTSGDYRHSFEHAGRRYSHIIDPRSGWPVPDSITSVSVVVEECMLADAWTKPLLVLGPEDGLRLAEERGLAAYFLVRGSHAADADLRAIPTRRFAERFLGAAKPGAGRATEQVSAQLPEATPSAAHEAPRANTFETAIPYAVSLILLILIIAALVGQRRRKVQRDATAKR